MNPNFINPEHVLQENDDLKRENAILIRKLQVIEREKAELLRVINESVSASALMFKETAFYKQKVDYLMQAGVQLAST